MPHEKQPFTPSSQNSGDVSLWALAGLGMQFFVALFAFAYAGNWMDTRFGSSPLMLFAGVFVGGGATFYFGYRRVTNPTRKNDVRSDAPNDHTSAS